jgi:hypothetical protein
VSVNIAEREVVVTARGVTIPAGTHYGHHALETYLPFRWPVRCWARGYRLEMLDASGRELSRELLLPRGPSRISIAASSRIRLSSASSGSAARRGRWRCRRRWACRWSRTSSWSSTTRS